jgi:hypothetical protein
VVIEEVLEENGGHVGRRRGPEGLGEIHLAIVPFALARGGDGNKRRCRWQRGARRERGRARRARGGKVGEAEVDMVDVEGEVGVRSKGEGTVSPATGVGGRGIRGTTTAGQLREGEQGDTTLKNEGRTRC